MKTLLATILCFTAFHAKAQAANPYLSCELTDSRDNLIAQASAERGKEIVLEHYGVSYRAVSMLSKPAVDLAAYSDLSKEKVIASTSSDSQTYIMLFANKLYFTCQIN